MNIRWFLLFIFAILFGANTYFYLKNRALKEDIASFEQLCQNWLAKLTKKADETPPIPVKARTIEIPQKSNSKIAKELLDEATDIEQLVSHSHQMQAVYRKYEFLILSAQIDEQERGRLKKLLLKREKLTRKIASKEENNAQDTGKLENQLNEIENQIELVLSDPLDFERYRLIRQENL